MLKRHPLGLVAKNALTSSIMDASTSVSAPPPTLNGPDFWACSESFNCAAAEDILYYYDQFGRGWDMGQAGRNLDVGHLEGGQGTCLDFGQSKGSATCSMLLCDTSTNSLYTLVTYQWPGRT